MSQRALPFQYAEENTSTGMTSLSGLPAYVDMAEVSGLVESVRTHMIVREGDQGWTDAQMVMSLILLNIAGGECVDDLRVLEKDEGLGRVLRSSETATCLRDMISCVCSGSRFSICLRESSRCC